MEPSSEEGKRSDYMAEVQKFAGKLGQELRDQQIKMESDDIKYILNMVISAVDLDKLEDDDIEEIGKKFEREEGEMSDEEVPAEEPTPEEDLGEMDGIDALESFVNTPVDMVGETDEIDLSSYADIDETDVNELLKMSDYKSVHHDDSDDDDHEFRQMAQKRFLKLSQEIGAKDARKKMLKTMSKLEKSTPKEDDVKEIDLDEIKNSINQSIGETLSKYFK